MSELDSCASYEDFRVLAKSKLPGILFDYIDGGSYSEHTLKKNVEDFRKVTLSQRILKDMSNIDSSIELFGESLSMPLVLAPVGFSGMYARRGECQAASAATKHAIPFTLSTVGICSIEEVASCAGSPPWFQLYMIKDRRWMATLLSRAQQAGCKVLFLTCDLQTPGARYRDVRSGMMRKLGVLDHIKRSFEGISKLGWTYDVFLRGRPHTFGNLDGVLPKTASFDEAWQWISQNFDPSVTWDDLAFIRQHWNGPIVIKGVMTEQDAMLATEHGVDGIVVSNHGGRQLDGAPSTISVLPQIADKVSGSVKILVDSGVRSGLDILKAVQCGADACMVGRHWSYALASDGEAGVSKMIDIYKAELKTAQILSGVNSISKYRHDT